MITTKDSGLEVFLSPLSLSGYSIMVITLGCQSSDTGSIPVIRSKINKNSGFIQIFCLLGDRESNQTEVLHSELARN